MTIDCHAETIAKHLYPHYDTLVVRCHSDDCKEEESPPKRAKAGDPSHRPRRVRDDRNVILAIAGKKNLPPRERMA